MDIFLTQREFSKAAEAGGFAKIILRSHWKSFTVEGQMRSGGCAKLAPTRGRDLRQFSNPAAALALLRKMGVTTVEVEMREWDVEMAALAMRLRPDVTARRLRDQRIAEAMYFPKRPPEPEVADRKDQLAKAIQSKVEAARRNL